MDLITLTALDQDLEAYVHKYYEQHHVVDSHKIAARYNELFIAYSSIEGIEALKRALFLQWYAVAEPSFLTGIGILDAKCESDNFVKLNSVLKGGYYDFELLKMLRHYFAIVDYYFKDHPEVELSINLLTDDFLPIQAYENRGLMGTYWRSIIK